MSGVTDEGFEAETVDSIKTAIEDELKNAFGASFNVRPTSVAGVFIGIVAQKLADLWNASEAIYGSQYPETAFGASLDQLSLLTGTQRLIATRSRATAGVTGDPGTVIPVGSRIRNEDTNTYWRVAEDNGAITIPSVSATTGVFESEDFGEVLGLAGTLTVIDTVIAGWDSVSNPTDATLGREQETDAELRLRRASLLQIQGAGTLDAIRSAVLEIDGVIQVTMLENVTLATDGNGLPAKSFETLVLQSGAATADIFQAIWDTKPAGISAYGSTVGTATDAGGTTRYTAYTPATDVLIYVSVTATTGSGFGATATGVANIKAAITAHGDGLLMGDDVIKQAVQARPFDVSGVVDVPTLYLDIYASPTATANLSIGVRSIARFDTARVTVTLL
jgi:uncharacterized phage protein gp47/JayE